MGYLLVHRHGHPGQWKFRGNQFCTVSAALNEACKRVASGDHGDFLIEAAHSRIVMNDVDVAAYCHASPNMIQCGRGSA